MENSSSSMQMKKSSEDKWKKGQQKRAQMQNKEERGDRIK